MKSILLPILGVIAAAPWIIGACHVWVHSDGLKRCPMCPEYRKRRRILPILLLLTLTGCNVYKAMYCDQRRPDGTCAHWAKTHPECTHDAYGDCTARTK